MPFAYYPRGGVVLDVLFEDFADGSGETLRTIEAVPRSIEIERNDHRSADTFRVELDFKDLALDPRAVRSIRVRILLGDVEEPDGELNPEADTAFMGFVDVPETKLDGSGEVVTLTGRDYTCVFLDQLWSGAAIDIARPLGAVVAELVASVAGTDNLTLGFSPGANELVLSNIIGRSKFAPHAGDDTWTVLVDLCGRAGLIPVIEFDLLLILTASDFGVDRATFLASGQFAPNRATFRYGDETANVSSLRYKRNFVEAKSKQIEVRCWDEQNRATRIVKYPTTPIVTKKKISTKGKVTEKAAPILPYYVSGSFTEAYLATLAQRIYTEAARQEVEGELETYEMVDLSGASSIPILGNGDRIRITLGTALTESIAGMSPAEAVLFLTSGPNALPVDAAQALVDGFTRANGLATEFYVRSATHRWTREDGYSCRLQFINLVGLGAA